MLNKTNLRITMQVMKKNIAVRYPNINLKENYFFRNSLLNFGNKY